MALTFPTGTRYPSNVELLPNRFLRPAFEELYGFDAQQDVGLPKPSISVVQFGSNGATISTGGVIGATSYTYERDTNSGFSNPINISTTTNLTVNDLGPLSKAVTYYYRIVATDGISTTTSNTRSIIIPRDFTTALLTQNQNTTNSLNTLTLTIQPEFDITSGTVTLTGLDSSQTGDNPSLSITSTNNIFGTAADWTQSTGTLVLTVSTTVPSNTNTFVTFDLTNPSSTPNSGSTGITLDSPSYNQASISGNFLYTVGPYIITDTTRDESVILADTSQTSYTIEQGADTKDLYVWDGVDWYIFRNN
jgi:hypothetical protein